MAGHANAFGAMVSRCSGSRPRLLIVAAVSGMLALGLAVQAVMAAAPGITLSPSVGPPSTTVTVNGTGFAAVETVVIHFSDTQVASTTSLPTGVFSTTFAVPQSAPPGNHTVTATGQTSGSSAAARFVVRTDWPRFHADAAGSGHNLTENEIAAANVGRLKLAWRTSKASIGSSPAVAGGVVYVASTDGKLYAFSALAGASCAGAYPYCTPLWTGSTGGTIQYSSPAVSGGVVYVGSTDGKLYAFDAAGAGNCSGYPRTCTPLWTGATGSVSAIQSSPTVSGGTVYVGSENDKLYAFSASGTTNCSGAPTVCTPLWTATTLAPIDSSPAVSGGTVYIGSEDHKLYAFDAAGVVGCSGSPTTCTPLWTGTTASPISFSSPAVAGGVVYVGSGDGKLYAFDAAGTTNCTGSPTACTALWTGATGNSISSSPAVADGVVYISSADNKLYAFSVAATTTCSGSPKTCTPLWTAAAGGFSSPAVANGLVYAGIGGWVYAFSAAGSTNCSGTPTVCLPMWSAYAGGNTTYSSPTVANGLVYIAEWNGSPPGLFAYAGPSSAILQDAHTTQQYLLHGSDGTTWQAMDSLLSDTFIPPNSGTAVLAANADLWTLNAGFNQDIGICLETGVSVSSTCPPSQVVGWKESGGYAGTFSPNAAAVQATATVTADSTYTAFLVWKTNKPMPSGDTIAAGAGASPKFSPTRLTVTLPDDSSVEQAASTTQQYTLHGSDGTTWNYVDAGALKLTVSPSGAVNTVLSANADLWTFNAGFNQDIGICVVAAATLPAGGCPAVDVVVWKESGGFAGTFSPNAALAQTVVPMSAQDYSVALVWKANKAMPSGDSIAIGAGSSPTFSPSRLTAVEFPSGAGGAAAASSAMQYVLQGGSNGVTWQVLDAAHLTITLPQDAPGCQVAIGGNADLWTFNAGFNQDIGIQVTPAGGTPYLAAWKESGGYAGTFSPNAAFVGAVVPVSDATSYSVTLVWKTNTSMPSADHIAAGAGSPGAFSPTTLTAVEHC